MTSYHGAITTENATKAAGGLLVMMPACSAEGPGLNSRWGAQEFLKSTFISRNLAPVDRMRHEARGRFVLYASKILYITIPE